MSKEIDYKNIGNQFRKYASNMLNTEYTNPDVPLYRFKKFIDENEIVADIVKSYINNVEYNYKDMIKSNSGWNSIDVPIDERKHFKGMYDYMTYIVDNEISITSLARKFYCSSRNITNVIQNFMRIAFKDLVDAIKGELESKIIDNEKNGDNVFNNNIIGNDNEIKINQVNNGETFDVKKENKGNKKFNLVVGIFTIIGVIVAIVTFIFGG